MTIPHFAFPLRFSDNGSAAVVEQDTLEEIEQNVKVFVLTDQGERLEVPGFGLRDPTFQTNIDTAAIIDSASQWDERAGILMTESHDFLQALARNLFIHVEESNVH